MGREASHSNFVSVSSTILPKRSGMLNFTESGFPKVYVNIYMCINIYVRKLAS